MIEEVGTIVAIEGDTAFVETTIKSTCGNCASNDHCGTGVVARTLAPKRERLAYPCTAEMQVGGQVVLGVAERWVVKASILAYLMPLIAFVLMVVVAPVFFPNISELVLIIVSFSTLALSYYWIHQRIKQTNQAQWMPQIIRIIPADIAIKAL